MTKLVSLDKVLEILENIVEECQVFEILKLPTTESNSESGWISVEYKKPPENIKILAYDEGTLNEIIIAEFW